MVVSNIVWDVETLNEWLKNPKNFIPGNNMKENKAQVVHVSSEQKRASLIAYLKMITAQ